ncbi:MAG: alginate export family protein [Pseudomonadota bacterium]
MRRAVLLATLVTASPAVAQSSDAWKPPTLTTTRYDEDWSTLADPAQRTGHWTEQFTYIPIGTDSYVSTGLELRLRNEKYHNTLWGGGAAPNDGYLWLRAMPYADLHVGRVRAFVEPIAAYAIGVRPSNSPIDQTRIDLLQGFVDVRLGEAHTGEQDATGLTLRAGRQMLSLGTERLVGTRYGPNVPLAFDGFRALASLGGATLSLIAARPVEPGLGSFDDRRSRTRALWGAYGAVKRARSGVDLYYLGYRNTQASFGGVKARELRHSVGARWFGNGTSWHWNIEGVAQFGRFAGGSIGAWTLGSEVGRHFPKVRFAPDVQLRLDYASGDNAPNDHHLGTFNALFPKGKYFGELSPVGPYNLINLNPQISATLGKGVTASLAGMAYWRASLADGVYDIPGHLLRAPGASRARFIGKEIEATLAWQATRELSFSASLSAFAPGGFIRETGSARTITMLGLESDFRF